MRQEIEHSAVARLTERGCRTRGVTEKVRAPAFVLALALGACASESSETPIFGDANLPLALPSDALAVDELDEAAWIIRTPEGIPHLFAGTEHDVYFLQGWVHAQDRLFQMDLWRRTASGTLAELVGLPGLSSDVELRTLGLRRAAERSWEAISADVKAALEAYCAGVNAYVARNSLPLEYQALELSEFADWTPVDTLAVVKLLMLQFAFSSDAEQTVALKTYQGVGSVAGFDGTALFFEDLYRTAPFDPAATIPDALQTISLADADGDTESVERTASTNTAWLRATSTDLAATYASRLSRVAALDPQRTAEVGSNTWVVAGRYTKTGRPILANDPHLSLPMPANFYQARLYAPALDVIGSGFAGAPGIVTGHNRSVSWGIAVNAVDVTDTYQEQIVPDPSSPSGLSTVYLGQLEPVIPIPQAFFYNQPGDGTPDNLVQATPDAQLGDVYVPAVVLIVPRRNQGPIVSLDLAAGTAISLQYTGFSGTREIEAFHRLDRATDLASFQQGLLAYDTGSLNFSYADRRGHIGYFTVGEIPLREDLQAGTVSGVPPFIIRDGTGGNEWIPASDLPADQAIPYAVLPQEELPQIIDPPAGFFVNANNSPLGNLLDNDPLNDLRPDGGIYYIEWYYRSSWRAGRITQMIRERLEQGAKLTADEMEKMQSDTVLRDAQYFVPQLLQAFENASAKDADPTLAAFAADKRVAEAISRLKTWRLNTPTGIPEGYDASDSDGSLSQPTETEIADSVAATIYAVWRSEAIRDVIDGTLTPLNLPLPDDRRSLVALKQLVDTFPERGGVGASGLDFFRVADTVAPEARLDVVLLRNLQAALDSLAGEAYAAAFGGSTNQKDYRWGRLHRIVFAHPLGAPFSVPPAGGAFPPPLADLSGIPTDGAFGTVDAAWHDARGQGSDGFMYDFGTARRFVADVGWLGIRARSSLPGGESGQLSSPHYVDLLGPYLTNDSYKLTRTLWDLFWSAESVELFGPAN